MTDVVTFLVVSRRGYNVYPGPGDTWWYAHEGVVFGPFKDMDEASYEALIDSELEKKREVPTQRI